ncbi:MAG: hypothetical protein JNK26_05100 [Candidatus Doudnabacteria bacterium]|nr:hypothetical protein [Candidatus Doudnabacteria bacterium]
MTNTQTLKDLITQSRNTEVIQAFKQVNEEVPEITAAYELAVNNPLMVSRIFYRYVQLVDQMTNLSEENLTIIAQYYRSKALEKPDSASHHNLLDVLNTISTEQKESLRDLIREAANPASPVFKAALTNLQEMMKNGSEYKASGQVPYDGDPLADRLIWGHTQLTAPYILIEFTVCHFIERFMSVAFAKIIPDIARHKDWFLSALTDVIALNAAREDTSKQVSRHWQVTREEGGLGWLSSTRLQAFRDIIASRQEV